MGASDQLSSQNNYAGGQHSGNAYFGRRSTAGGPLNITTGHDKQVTSETEGGDM